MGFAKPHSQVCLLSSGSFFLFRWCTASWTWSISLSHRGNTAKHPPTHKGAEKDMRPGSIAYHLGLYIWVWRQLSPPGSIRMCPDFSSLVFSSVLRVPYIFLSKMDLPFALWQCWVNQGVEYYPRKPLSERYCWLKPCCSYAILYPTVDNNRIDFTGGKTKEPQGCFLHYFVLRLFCSEW